MPKSSTFGKKWFKKGIIKIVFYIIINAHKESTLLKPLPNARYEPNNYID